MNSRFSQLVGSKPWIWALLGSVVMWISIGFLSKQFAINMLIINVSLACFLAIVSLGQMFAVSSGRGGIDLSIPYVITFTAFLSIGIMNGSDGNLVLGLLVCLGVGAIVGLLNAISILVFRIPPIIATMAIGFILNTAILIYAANFSAFKASPILSEVTKGDVLGIPWIIFVLAVIAVIIGFVLVKTPYGRSLMAVGQNKEAAFLAGIKVNRAILIAYVVSGLLAGLGGVLIAARVGGAFLQMGDSYLLESVGAVVIGGTLISGGKATIIGTLLGALFLTLIVTLMGVTHLPIGIQNIIEGIVIILVLAISKKE
jgi:ribose transport system permease protein